MTEQERDAAIEAVKRSDLYLPLKAARIRQIQDEYNSPDNQDLTGGNKHNFSANSEQKGATQI